MLQDADGQVIEAVSISAGLDYPGIGPQLAALMAAGRLLVSSATDAEAVAAVRQVARTEGILAAVESAHAVAALPDVLARVAVEQGSDAAARKRVAAAARKRVAADPARPVPREAVIVLGLSGRGDKDLAALGLKEVGR
jgi:tryptophan synthase beta subunit